MALDRRFLVLPHLNLSGFGGDDHDVSDTSMVRPPSWAGGFLSGFIWSLLALDGDLKLHPAWWLPAPSRRPDFNPKP
ncbi:hypothetical protein RchiOBHm_Chr1g0358971 [Rosa chinensis]|uniref:Uncharacterized protein n=1 Tax=Rosa chinensis TaxID=74649 RepID=A0A2P6SI92_ROSCH|nr:hypothetical protein RchiOBHm_Chr1g0358971 [Rosa chinensis]